MVTTDIYTNSEKYQVAIELEQYVAEPELPRFETTAKLARRWLKAQGKPSHNLLYFVTAVKALEQLWNDEHKSVQPE